MKIADVTATTVTIPLKPPVSPYLGSYFTYTSAKSTIVKIETDNGLVGFGEAKIPYSQQFNKSLIDTQFKPSLIGRDPFDLEAFLKLFELSATGLDLSILSGIEMALWDIIGKATNTPLCKLIGGVIRERIELAACIGIKSPEETAKNAKMYVRKGFKTLKCKGGRDLFEDIAKTRAIREVVGEEVAIRVDTNAAYSPGTAIRFLKAVEDCDLQYMEQPCKKEALKNLASIRGRVKTPIAPNESCGTAVDILNLISAGAADIGVVDVMSAGGILPLKKVAAIAEAAGIPLVMHCGFDLGLRTATMLHIAASTPSFIFANDSTYYAQDGDIIKDPLRIENGRMAVPTRPGLGVSVDESKLEEYSRTEQVERTNEARLIPGMSYR